MLENNQLRSPCPKIDICRDVRENIQTLNEKISNYSQEVSELRKFMKLFIWESSLKLWILKNF